MIYGTNAGECFFFYLRSSGSTVTGLTRFAILTLEKNKYKHNS